MISDVLWRSRGCFVVVNKEEFEWVLRGFRTNFSRFRIVVVILTGTTEIGGSSGGDAFVLFSGRAGVAVGGVCGVRGGY